MASIAPVKINPNIPALSPGDTVRVSLKIVEGDKTRLQPFQGVVINIHRYATGGSFTVRRVTFGIGVERTFLFASPLLDKVEVLRQGKVRRAKLYYMRGISDKASRLKERRRKELPAEVAPAPETQETKPESV